MEHINKDEDEDNEDVWCTVSNKYTPIKQIIVKLFLNSSFERTLNFKWALLNETYRCVFSLQTLFQCCFLLATTLVYFDAHQ